MYGLVGLRMGIGALLGWVLLFYYSWLSIILLFISVYLNQWQLSDQRLVQKWVSSIRVRQNAFSKRRKKCRSDDAGPLLLLFSFPLSQLFSISFEVDIIMQGFGNSSFLAFPAILASVNPWNNFYYVLIHSFLVVLLSLFSFSPLTLPSSYLTQPNRLKFSQ